MNLPGASEALMVSGFVSAGMRPLFVADL